MVKRGCCCRNVNMCADELIFTSIPPPEPWFCYVFFILCWGVIAISSFVYFIEFANTNYSWESFVCFAVFAFCCRKIKNLCDPPQNAHFYKYQPDSGLNNSTNNTTVVVVENSQYTQQPEVVIVEQPRGVEMQGVVQNPVVFSNPENQYVKGQYAA